MQKTRLFGVRPFSAENLQSQVFEILSNTCLCHDLSTSRKKTTCVGQDCKFFISAYFQAENRIKSSYDLKMLVTFVTTKRA